MAASAASSTQIKIVKSFLDPSSPRAFIVGEFVTVPSATAEAWIAAGNAVTVRSLLTQSAPARQQREKAVKA